MDDQEAWGQLVSLTDFDSDHLLLTKNRLTIGRAPDCDLAFPGNKLVSGQHCSIERDEDGRVWLKDSSTNGTLLNLKSKVTKGNRKELNHGDEFYVVYKKDNEELNIGYIYQSMEELKREGNSEDLETQEYSSDDILEATLADTDVNEVEETEESPDSRKRPAESTSPTEPAKKLKCETKDSIDCKKKTDIKKSSESTKSGQRKCDTETGAVKGDKMSAAEPKKDEIEEALVCIICQEIMHDCVSLQPCMHTFCAGCYSDWMKRSPECPSCRMGVDRINKNHIVNNLIEAYLKEHPDKKRPEEEIKELDAKNKISRDMLYPAEQKDKEYDPDESVNNSDESVNNSDDNGTDSDDLQGDEDEAEPSYE